ncbi:MAG: RpiB/LacA/LacB family sugar-phosphate isomerase [Pyrinomonadaceae bacterium]
MPERDDVTRERVKDLVRQILKTVPTEPEPPRIEYPERVIVNSLKEAAAAEFDRDESAKSLITEDDLRGLDAGARVRISQKARLTPLAEDIVREKGIELIRKAPRENEVLARSVAIGADHGGFEIKEHLKGFLVGLGLVVRDVGTKSKEAVDYPDLAYAVARAVGDNQVDVGIIIDGAGIGSAMTANKVPNVRAAACYSVALAKNSREHNGANVLTLGAGQNSVSEIEDIVRAFLTTQITEDRHKRRVAKIDEIERKYKRW